MPKPSQAKIRFMYIFFGANDACVEKSSSRQHVPLPLYRDNLRKIIQHPSVQAHNPKIFLINPPPINQHQLEAILPERQRTAEQTKKYADACRELGAELGVPVLDLWTVIARRAGWEEGQKLPGSIDIAENSYLKHVLRDGKRPFASKCQISD